MAGADPLILTLGFDAGAFERLDALRRAHFPARLNLIPAHLTLFHHLPGDRLAEMSDQVGAAASAIAPFEVRFTGLRKLGRGTALNVEAPELITLRSRLAQTFADHLTPQDRQGFRPHVTVQNKVAPAEATALFDQLSPGFQPWSARAESLLLWWYRGGPWEPAGVFALSDIG